MAKESTDLVIQAPRQGIAKSPHLGFGDVRNIDIASIPGVARLNKVLGKRTGTTVTTRVNWAKQNPTSNSLFSGEFFALDASGNAYRGINSGATWSVLAGNSLTDAHGNGMEIWEDYLFVARDRYIDTFGPVSGAAFTATLANPMVITCTSGNHGLATNDRLILYSDGQISSSAPVTFTNNGTAYFVNVASPTTFTLSAASGGVELNTSGGSQSGNHYFRAWKSQTAAGFGDMTATYADALWHPMINSKLDGKLYGGESNQVFKVTKTAGQTFVPGVSASYTFANACMTTALPSGHRIKCLAEQNNNLMMGTWKGDLVDAFPVADIFTWDGSAPSYGQPIQINDYGVHAMLNVDGNLIVLAGISGSIYQCDGARAVQIGKLPIELPVSNGAYIIWSPGAICKFKDKIFIGSGGSTTLGGQGIYSLQLTGQGSVLTLEHLNSQLTDGSVSRVIISALVPVNSDSILAAWTSGSDEGIDTTATSSYSYSTDYSGYFDSPLYVVGTINNKKKYTEIEFQLAKPLAAGEGIKFYYRKNLNDSFTAIENQNGGTLTLDFETLGAVISHIIPADITDAELLQFRIALKGSTTTTPQFKAAYLR